MLSALYLRTQNASTPLFPPARVHRVLRTTIPNMRQALSRYPFQCISAMPSLSYPHHVAFCPGSQESGPLYSTCRNPVLPYHPLPSYPQTTHSFKVEDPSSLTLHASSLCLAHATASGPVERCANTIFTRAFLFPTHACTTSAPQSSAFLIAGDTRHSLPHPLLHSKRFSLSSPLSLPPFPPQPRRIPHA
jgi:hypothetical protein